MKTTVYDEGRASDVPQKAKGPSRIVWLEWLAIAGLILLSFIPVVAGTFRLTQLAGGTTVTPENVRFFASPLPVVIHIVSATLYAILGAFQFANSFRRRWPGWHRAAGRVVVISGLLVGLSGLWMTIFYPLPAGDGALLYAIRLVFGSAMIGSIVLGFTTIQRGQVSEHRVWMMRGYAIGLGAGTQALTLMVGQLIFGPPNEFSRAMLMGAGWVINLVVAEWVIRQRPAHMALPISQTVQWQRQNRELS